MDEPLGPFSLVLLIIPAIALRLAVRALYGRRRLTAAEPMQVLLSLSSLILLFMAGLGIVAGLIGLWWPREPSVIAFIVSFVMMALLMAGLLIVVMMVVDRSRRSEHRALVWALAAAAERGIPLSEAARAYADETLGDTGARSLALAEAIERGQPLSQAVRAARLRMGSAMRLAVRLGEELGMLGPAMRQQMNDSQSIDMALRDAVIRFFYLGVVLLLLIGIGVFLLIKIVPVFEKLFEEAHTELPAITQWVIDAANQWKSVALLVGIGYIAIALIAFLIALAGAVSYSLQRTRSIFHRYWELRRLIVMVVVVSLFWPFLVVIGPVLYYVGWFPRNLPVVWRFFRRYDGAIVMRGLALTVRRGMPLPAALGLLADSYPLSIVAGQLRAAADRVASGMDWRDSLCRAGLIAGSDAAVLGAAQRAGNVDWALEEMADSALRREMWRVQSLIFALYPAALLVVAAIIFVFVVGLFLPVVTLVYNQIPT